MKDINLKTLRGQYLIIAKLIKLYLDTPLSVERLAYLLDVQIAEEVANEEEKGPGWAWVCFCEIDKIIKKFKDNPRRALMPKYDDPLKFRFRDLLQCLELKNEEIREKLNKLN